MGSKVKVVTEKEIPQEGCGNDNHNYQPINTQGFYKRDKDNKYDTNVVYNTVFCTKCGDTKEIVICRR